MQQVSITVSSQLSSYSTSIFSSEYMSCPVSPHSHIITVTAFTDAIGRVGFNVPFQWWFYEWDDPTNSVTASSSSFLACNSYDCVVPYVNIILHRRRFWAKSAASWSVRWCCFRSCWTVLCHVMRGRPSCLLQSAGGEANRHLLAFALSSMRIICPNRVSQREWIIAVSLGCFVTVRHRIIWSWYTGRWWVGCYIWYNEEGTGRGHSLPRPSLLYQM